MLGRSYAAMQRFPEAKAAFARALQLSPDDAQILADQADVLAMLQGRKLEGEPLRLVEQALKNNPSNLKALALAGTAAFERKDFAGAIKYWGLARAVAPPDSEFAQGLERGLAEARAAAGGSARCGTAGGGARHRADRCGRPRAWRRSAAASACHRRWPRGWRRATRCSSSPAPPRARACRWRS